MKMRFQKARGTKRVINGGEDGNRSTFYVPEAEKRILVVIINIYDSNDVVGKASQSAHFY